MVSKRMYWSISTLVLLALLLAACGQAATPTPETIIETVEVLVTEEPEAAPRHVGRALETGRLGRLRADQLEFVETFIRCEGKLNRMERELGLSYPTLRSRLTEVITQMGFELGPEPAEISDKQRHRILDELASGEISSEQAMQQLQGS